MDCDINTSKYRCLGLSGYPASNFYFLVCMIIALKWQPCVNMQLACLPGALSQP